MSIKPQITLHWLDDSRSQRILWLLEELGLDYEIKVYKRNTETLLAPPELREVHPTGKSPVVTITENGKTLSLAESGAITEFLIERYGNSQLVVSPSDGDFAARADYLYWLHYAEGSAMTPLMLAMVFARMPKSAPWFLRPVVNTISGGAISGFVLPRLRSQYKYLDKHLEGKEYFAGGKLTGADIMMSFIAEALASTPLDASDFPNLRRWHESMQQREAYKKAEEKGGKNDLGRFTR
ncbi:hypothetical protein JCM10213_005185 [Rhodosporidiobolus nylandii]